ncbi:MAG: hypothetical protein IJ087_17205 [Eggerthellaceae bacterium]|nr:hypothetical protein [Eggerthellaceae bacterium]
MAEHEEERYANQRGLSEEEMEKVAGGDWWPFHDLPAHAPTKSNCPNCGTLNRARRVNWNAYTQDGPVGDDRCEGIFVCMNCGTEWTITTMNK